MGKVEIEALDDGRDEQIADHLPRAATLSVFKSTVDRAPARGGGGVRRGRVVHTGEDVNSADLARLVEDVPALRELVARLAGGDESPAVVASAVELVLEGLHLSKRLNKDGVDGRATYRFAACVCPGRQLAGRPRNAPLAAIALLNGRTSVRRWSAVVLAEVTPGRHGLLVGHRLHVVAHSRPGRGQRPAVVEQARGGAGGPGSDLHARRSTPRRLQDAGRQPDIGHRAMGDHAYAPVETLGDQGGDMAVAANSRNRVTACHRARCGSSGQASSAWAAYSGRPSGEHAPAAAGGRRPRPPRGRDGVLAEGVLQGEVGRPGGRP